jgi:hypothetical protein
MQSGPFSALISIFNSAISHCSEFSVYSSNYFDFPLPWTLKIPIAL